MDVERVAAAMRKKASKGRPATQMRGDGGGGPKGVPFPRDEEPGPVTPPPLPLPEVIDRLEEVDLPVVDLSPPPGRYYGLPQGTVLEDEGGE